METDAKRVVFSFRRLSGDFEDDVFSSAGRFCGLAAVTDAEQLGGFTKLREYLFECFPSPSNPGDSRCLGEAQGGRRRKAGSRLHQI